MTEEIELKDRTEHTGAPPLFDVAGKASDVAEEGTTIATVLAQTMKLIRGSAIDSSAYESLLAELTVAPSAARLVISSGGDGLSGQRR